MNSTTNIENTKARAGSLARRVMRPLRVQWIPNLIRSERRICLTRIRWERGKVSVAGGGYSAKLSISLCFVPDDFWVGVFWKRLTEGELTHRGTVYVCLIPMLPLRFKLIKSWGSIIP